MTETEWRWADPSGQQRLVRIDELRAGLASGVLAPNTPVWRPGWKEWKPAHEVPELTTSALAAANGVLPNIPPPPLAVVAVQAAFESTGSHLIPPETHKIEEPPPPPRYVPAPTRAQAGMFHTPSHPIRVPANLTPPAPESKPKLPPSPDSGSKLPPSSQAKAKGPPAPLSGAKLPPSPDSKSKLPPSPDSKSKLPPSPDSRSKLAASTASPRVFTKDNHDPPTVRPMGDEKIAARSPQPPAGVPKPGVPKPGGLSQLVRPSSVPPPAPRTSSVPPPAPRTSSLPPPMRASSKPPPPKSIKPPPPKAQNIEELSGSMLLPDASGSQKTDAIEELSGSILLADASGSQSASALDELSASILPTVPGAMAAITKEQAQGKLGQGNSAEELSGSFLLDAGSTGALPSVDSEAALRATSPYQPAPAPFAAIPAPLPAAGEPPRPVIDPASERASQQPEAVSPWAMPLGPASVPPPQPHVATSPQFRAPLAEEQRITVPRVTVPGELPEPVVGDRPSAPSASPAGATLVGVPPPPDLIVLSPDAQIHPGPSPDVAPVSPPPASRAPMPNLMPAPQATRSYGSRESIPQSVPLPPERSSARLHDFRALSPDPKMKYVLPALGLLGTLVMLGVIGLVVGMFRKKPSEELTPAERAAETATTATTSSTSAPAAAPASAPSPIPGGVTIGGACSLAGTAHVIAPRAVVQSGVEVQVVGARLALGFASGPRNGIAVAIDPSSLAATQTARVKAPDAIRRLVPVPAARGIAAAADVDREGDSLFGRRTVSADPPFDLGLGGGGVAWAPVKSRAAEVLWTLDGDAPIEAVRAAPLDPANRDAGWAIAFRRGTSIFAGAVNGGATFTPKGTLVRVDGLGPQVGSPAVAAQDGAVLVAWADRASASDPWSVRWMRFAPGDASADAKAFVPGEGALGDAMSPAIAPAAQGRFVLAWTEGPVSSHQVRAQTLSGAGVAIGKPFAVSEPGVNAGQAQVAVLPDGHGVVAYLASTDSGPKAAYQVVATPIACP